MSKLNPIDIINVMRNSDSYIEDIYLNGGCYQFYKILKTIFPGAQPYINERKDHIATLIDNNLYDITGKVEGVFSELTKNEETNCEKWSFAENYWLYKECPHCEEYVTA